MISQDLSFSRINPTNVSEVTARFSKNKQDPVFTYQETDDFMKTLQTILKELTMGDTPIDALIEKKRKELINKIHLLNSIGTSDFTKYSLRLYPRPNKQLLKKAHELIILPPSPPSPKISRKEARKLIRTTFKQLGFSWKIKNTGLVTSARVNPTDRVLELRKQERFSQQFVERLIVHEIGVHAVRAENAKQQPLKVFFHGLANYLETEEGLAAYAEYCSGLLDDTQLRIYAGRVIAVDYALQHGFKETYSYLRKFFAKRQALKLTIRVKRGLSDTSQPGAYTKDAVYLKGFLEIQHFVKKGGDIRSLFIGKIGIKDLPTLADISDLAAVKYDPFPIFASFNTRKHDAPSLPPDHP